MEPAATPAQIRQQILTATGIDPIAANTAQLVATGRLHALLRRLVLGFTALTLGLCGLLLLALGQGGSPAAFRTGVVFLLAAAAAAFLGARRSRRYRLEILPAEQARRAYVLALGGPGLLRPGSGLRAAAGTLSGKRGEPGGEDPAR